MHCYNNAVAVAAKKKKLQFLYVLVTVNNPYNVDGSTGHSKAKKLNKSVTV